MNALLIICALSYRVQQPFEHRHTQWWTLNQKHFYLRFDINIVLGYPNFLKQKLLQILLYLSYYLYNCTNAMARKRQPKKVRNKLNLNSSLQTI